MHYQLVSSVALRSDGAPGRRVGREISVRHAGRGAEEAPEPAAGLPRAEGKSHAGHRGAQELVKWQREHPEAGTDRLPLQTWAGSCPGSAEQGKTLAACTTRQEMLLLTLLHYEIHYNSASLGGKWLFILQALLSELREHSKKVDELKATLRKLIADNPDSPEAESWRQLLQEIGTSHRGKEQTQLQDRGIQRLLSSAYQNDALISPSLLI